MPGIELWICCLILRGLNGDSTSMRLVSTCREERIMFIDGFAIATGEDVCSWWTLDLACAFAKIAYTVMVFEVVYCMLSTI
jgi:hypothetical protein